MMMTMTVQSRFTNLKTILHISQASIYDAFILNHTHLYNTFIPEDVKKIYVRKNVQVVEHANLNKKVLCTKEQHQFKKSLNAFIHIALKKKYLQIL